MLYKPLTILMADDDEEDMELVEEAIKKLEPATNLYKVSNGKDAIEYLENQTDDELPNLIILDYNMPELTGSQILSIIREQRRYEKTPKIILSTSNAPTHVQECIENGATEYFVKPANFKELEALAKKMLDYCNRP